MILHATQCLLKISHPVLKYLTRWGLLDRRSSELCCQRGRGPRNLLKKILERNRSQSAGGRKRQAGGSDEPKPEPKRRGKKVPAGGSDEPKPEPKRRGKKVPAGGSDEVKPEPKRRGKKVPAGGSDETKPEPKRRGKKVPAGGSDETKPEPKRRGKKVQAGGSDEEPKRPGGSDMPKPESTADSSDKPKPRPKARVRKLAAPSNGAAGSTATELAAGGLAMASAVATCAAADVAETGDGVSGGGPPDAPPPDDASTTATVGDEDRKKKASRKSSAISCCQEEGPQRWKELGGSKGDCKAGCFGCDLLKSWFAPTLHLHSFRHSPTPTTITREKGSEYSTAPPSK